METVVQKGSRGRKLYAIIVSVVAVLSVAAFLVVFFHAGYHTKILQKLGLKEKTAGTNHALLAWENCLEQMHYDTDIVFFGDSITYMSNFSACFPDVQIVNLGYSGDTLAGMAARVSMVQAVNPEKIFLMGGINGLTDANLAQSVNQYARLLDSLQESLPEAQIYIQSVLPVGKGKQTALMCRNSTIVAFNRQLQMLAQERGLHYIELYTLYEKDGQLNPSFSEDGIHIKPEAYTAWEGAIRPFITHN